MRSTSSALAIPCSTQRSASAAITNWIRLPTKPGTLRFVDDVARIQASACHHDRFGDVVCILGERIASMSASGETRTWTGRVQEAAVAALPPERLLPDTQPAYVASWVYVFGVLTLAAFVVVLVA